MKKVFIVGCARSGTTWLQIILGSHPDVATVRETHLFDRYVAGLFSHWLSEENSSSKDGLRALMQQPDFDAACRGFTDAVFDRIAARNPGARIVLEKTATHLRHWRLIRRLYPDALFLNIVRDPRAVVSSLLAVGRESWGKGGPQDLQEAAMFWRSSVRIGRDELAGLGPDFLEIRYEDLSADPDAVLARVYQWLAIPTLSYDRDRFSIEALRTDQTKGEPSSPQWDNRENFFRRGEVGGWQHDFSRDQIELIEAICLDLMEEIGYAPYVPPENPPPES
jgi:hypothetical protein